MHKLVQDEADMTTNTAILKALPEPNRLRIFATLMYGDSCNRELQDRITSYNVCYTKLLRSRSRSWPGFSWGNDCLWMRSAAYYWPRPASWSPR